MQDQPEKTPLHIAVRYNRIKMVRMLLDARADPNIQDEEGCTPLHCAVRFYEIGIAQMLVNFGSRLTIKNNKGFTPIEEAARRKYNKLGIIMNANGVFL